MAQTSKTETTQKASIPQKEQTPRRVLPQARRLGSFEEALSVGMKKYDGVLRELAK